MIAKRLTIPLILIVAAGLLGAGLSQGVVTAQEQAPQSPVRLRYDGLLDMPRLPLAGAAAAPDAVPASALAPEYAAWSRLVFQSARNGHDWEVFGARGDGSDQVNLSNHPAMDIHPRLNRGATRIVFASDRDGNYEIYAMNADGSSQTRLTYDGADDVYPAWSPDGSRIAFQSYRDGQADIYVMNADGSWQTRLTDYSGYDGQPTWSPDGTQIAFLRAIWSDVLIWAMNADGSSVRQLNSTPFSQHPTWSGGRLACDADGDRNGWQELWELQPFGGPIYQPPEANTDAWAGSWSPDGRYLAFTRVSWIYEQDQWYWTTATLDAVDRYGYNPMRLSSTGTDWNPDWQSIDLQAPASRVALLPAQSPYRFTVQWTGSDVGPSGLAKIYVQAYPNLLDEWYYWQESTTDGSSVFEGIGGHTYYFRARADDVAGNQEPWPADHQAFTTVEALPPVTAVKPLPAFTRGDRVTVWWGGSDPGGSGIQYYDVQVQDVDAGDWADWWMRASDTSATRYDLSPGHTYRFRVRGTDNAQNVEPWPPGAGDTETTLYRWAISGTVRDSGGAPVPGAAIAATPAAMSAAMSGADGAYLARVAADAATYAASTAKAGYGSLPATSFASAEDAQIDLVLPPADNVVRNWGFEAGSLQPDWQTSGPIPATVTTTLRHTGERAALLGGSGLEMLTPVNVSGTAGASDSLRMVVDKDGGVHVAWHDAGSGNADIAYARRAGGSGSFLPPSRISTPGESRYPALAVGSDGTAHVVWSEWTGVEGYIAYASRSTGGSWSAPRRLSTGAAAQDAQIAVDANNTVHVVWFSDFVIYYASKTVSGNWSNQLAISATSQNAPFGPQLAVDQAGQVHVIWKERGPVYTCRSLTGAWSAPQDIAHRSEDTEGQRIAVEANGKVHVAWTGYVSNGAIWYVEGSCQGDWSPPQTIASDPAGDRYPSLIVDRKGAIHLAWNHNEGLRTDVHYARSADGSSWSTPQSVSVSPLRESHSPSLAVDDSDTVHVAWHGVASEDWQAYYSRRTGDGAWTAPRSVSLDTASVGATLVVERSGRAHVGWLAGASQNARDVYYTSSAPAQLSGDSTLRQAITVPPASANPGLSFLYRLGDVSSAGGSSFSVAVQDNSSTTPLLTTDTVTADWIHCWLDLKPWAGRNVTLIFTLRQVAGELQPWAAIDEVTVGSTHPDAWVKLLGPRAALPGQQAGYTITYGNRGGVTASSAQVTLQLPLGLAFVSADPPPSTVSPSLRWDVGDLAGQSGPGPIQVTLQVAASTTRGTRLTTTAAIAADMAEIEQANNTAHGTLYVGCQLYLPVVWR